MPDEIDWPARANEIKPAKAGCCDCDWMLDCNDPTMIRVRIRQHANEAKHFVWIESALQE